MTNEDEALQCVVPEADRERANPCYHIHLSCFYYFLALTSAILIPRLIVCLYILINNQGEERFCSKILYK